MTVLKPSESTPCKSASVRKGLEEIPTSDTWQVLFARVFTVLRSVANARCFSHSVFATPYADLHRFAAKNSYAVENDREKLGVAFAQRWSFRTRLRPLNESANCK